MLHPKSTTELARIVADLMEDLWHKRSFLNDRAYFAFRLDASSFDTDTSTTVFAHYLIEGNRWHFMMTDSQFDVTYEMITERLEDDDARAARRVESWRHYAFTDLVSEYIQKELDDAIASNINGEVSQLTIWDTFPAQKIY